MGAYGEEVALPAAVSKEVTLWVPGEIMGGSSIAAGTVQVSSGGQVLAEQRVDFRSNRTPYWPLVAVLAESPSVARALSSIELPVQGLPVPLSVAKLSVTDIPSSTELLNALSGLVIQGDAAVTLTVEQRRVLIDCSRRTLGISGVPATQTVAALLPIVCQ